MKGLKITIKPLTAELLIDSEYLGIGDPYCVIKCGRHKFTTRVSKDTGKYPNWKDVFEANYPEDGVLHVSCLDRDHISKSDFIGEGVFDLSGNNMQLVELNNKERFAGKILVQVSIQNGHVSEPRVHAQLISAKLSHLIGKIF